ncbi:hypothetical protein NIES4071_101590 (plasmid) [Calothrix sp. NIES-4071]|nr:hypothetical protein NIES4071_101590 [Calothrix sp. NIES-4071]BAZ64540.1 hypothetical protein NIES4105_102730 [Calothrix sp. NIES-4105]
MLEKSYKLFIPAPHFLLEAMNVAKEAKEWIGIFYQATNATWSDGGWSATFSYFDVYYPLLHNEAMSIQLASVYQKIKPEYSIDFGSDDTEPSHILLLNRIDHQLYLADFKEGMKFLREQYPKPDPNKKAEITKEQLAQILLEHQKQVQECMQNPSSFGIFESFGSISTYRNKIITWFNNYCLN